MLLDDDLGFAPMDQVIAVASVARHAIPGAADLAGARVSEVERRLRALGCPKINLQVRRDNADAVGFYRAIGYSQDDVISLGKRLENDERDA